PTVAAVLVGAVCIDVTGEVMPPNDAGKATAAHDALHVDELAFLENVGNRQRLSDFELRRVLGRAPELANDTRGRHAGLLEGAGGRLAGVLVFAGIDAENESVVPVLFFGAFADDDRSCLDDRTGDDGSVFFEDLRHPELSPDESGVLVHNGP